MERKRLLLISATAVALTVAAMAAVGLAYPHEADLPLRAFYKPLIPASVIAFVFAVALVSPAAGMSAALICASPMWMLVAAPPAGPIGAFLFFVVASLIAGAGVAAAEIVRLVISTAR